MMGAAKKAADGKRPVEDELAELVAMADRIALPAEARELVTRLLRLMQRLYFED